MKHIRQKKKTLFALFVFCILFLASLILVNTQTQTNTLRIVGTGMKEEVSFGTDIRISNIKLNNEELKQEDVALGGVWDTASGYVAVQTDESTWIEVKCRETDNLDIAFQMQQGSGYIKIYKNDELLEEKNLYSETYKVENYVLEGKGMDITQQILPFVSLVLGLIVEVLLLGVLLSNVSKVKWVRKYKFIPEISLFFGAIMLHLSTEIINSNLLNLGIVATIENVLLYLIAMLIVYILTARVGFSVAIVSFAWLIFAVANYYVTLFRGLPLTLGDFYAIQTAANVASVYEYILPIKICVAFVIMLLMLGVIANFNKRTPALRIKKRMLLCVPAILLVFFVIYSGIYDKSMNLWQPKENVVNYGLGVNMVSSVLNMQLEKPYEYSEKACEDLLDTYDDDKEEFNPNIIVIMNESFADLSVLNESLDSNLYMPYYNSLQENVIKGIAVSSALGGKTANAEYEFLTGNSTFFMKEMYPYQQLVYRPTFALPRVLKERGYNTLAIHPYTGSGYNRPSVYSHFAFDDYFDIEDFEDPDLVRTLFISDKDCYEKIISEYEKNKNTKQPMFIFSVTIQNHSVYSTGFFQGKEELVEVPGLEGKYSDVEEYLTLIKESDQALPLLVDYFSGVEEPTILLLFGDHQPNFSKEFYEEFCLEQNYYQKKYEVPFMIWANYDIEEEEGIYTSTNYLSSLFFEKTGVKCSPYQNYLLELRETIPAINQNGFMTSDGTWHTQDEIENKKIQEYWNLEYYHLYKDATKK